MGETVGVGDGVSEDDAVGTLIEGLGDVSEPFLPGCVPDVESDLAAVVVDPLNFEIYSDGAEVVGLEGVLAIAHQQTSFADAAVPHHKVLEGDILLVAHY